MVERMGLVSDKLLAIANEIIDDCLERAGGNPTSREGAARWVEQKREVQRRPELLALAHSFADRNGFRRPKHCQIALRFPGERVDEALTWHIDKNHFDRLLGVYLND